MEPNPAILIFKTNIKTLSPDSELRQSFNVLREIQQWTIDHEDCDCVLRVVTEKLTPKNIITIVQAHGYTCLELE